MGWYAVSSSLELVFTSLGRNSDITGEKCRKTLRFLCFCLVHCGAFEKLSGGDTQLDNREVTMRLREKSALFKAYCQFRPPLTTKWIILKVLKEKKKTILCPWKCENQHKLEQAAPRLCSVDSVFCPFLKPEMPQNTLCFTAAKILRTTMITWWSWTLSKNNAWRERGIAITERQKKKPEGGSNGKARVQAMK